SEAWLSKWRIFNESIRGNGATPITNVDYIAFEHTDKLNNGFDNMKVEYRNNGNDVLHPNNEGRQIMAASWREGLETIGVIDKYVVVPEEATVAFLTLNVAGLPGGNTFLVNSQEYNTNILPFDIGSEI